LKDVLEKALPSRDQRLALVDRCLSDSDSALSHAWALKSLVDRYSEEQEDLLKPESDAKLREMLRAHLEALSHANNGLESLVELLPPSDPAATVPPSNWRQTTLALFAAVQQQDRLIATLLAGSETDGQSSAMASAEFRSAHHAINALLAGLQNLAAYPAAK
jgi:hypothetical protein